MQPERVERVLQYKFRDPLLLEEALTHRSYYDDGRGPCYKRLAFLGDSALYFLFAKKFYRKHSTLENNKLTDLRKVYIANKKLARVAVRHNLYELLRHKCPYFDINVSQFTKSVQKEPEGNHGIKGPKVLADIVEAIVGAVYVDSNFDLEELDRVTMLLLGEETLPNGQCSKKHWLKGIFTCILAAFFICCSLVAIDFSSSDHAIVEISFLVWFAGFAWFCLKLLLWVIQRNEEKTPQVSPTSLLAPRCFQGGTLGGGCFRSLLRLCHSYHR